MLLLRVLLWSVLWDIILLLMLSLLLLLLEHFCHYDRCYGILSFYYCDPLCCYYITAVIMISGVAAIIPMLAVWWWLRAVGRGGSSRSWACSFKGGVSGSRGGGVWLSPLTCPQRGDSENKQFPQKSYTLHASASLAVAAPTHTTTHPHTHTHKTQRHLFGLTFLFFKSLPRHLCSAAWSVKTDATVFHWIVLLLSTRAMRVSGWVRGGQRR